MKFAQFFTPTGHPVHVSANFTVMGSLDRPLGTLIKSAVGQQEVQQSVDSVVRALEALE